MEEIGAYDRSSSDKSRQSDGGSDDDIESKRPESRCDSEGEVNAVLVESEIENEDGEHLMDEDDETTDSRTNKGKRAT